MKILSDSVSVEYKGLTYTLSKLARHVLYCVDDERPVSARYTQQQVDDAINVLIDLGLIKTDPTRNEEYLTEDGTELVDLLRNRPGN